MSVDWVAFGVYVVVLAFTPGPNNLVSFNVARQVGLRQARPSLWGLALSFVVIDVVIVALAAASQHVLPAIEPWLKALGSAYLLWLAWESLRPSTPRDAEPRSGRLFWQGVLVNVTNVKVILFFLVGVTGYLIPGLGSVGLAAAFSTVLIAACCVSNFIWAAGGSALSRWLGRRERATNIVIAALLALCAITLWV